MILLCQKKYINNSIKKHKLRKLKLDMFFNDTKKIFNYKNNIIPLNILKKRLARILLTSSKFSGYKSNNNILYKRSLLLGFSKKL